MLSEAGKDGDVQIRRNRRGRHRECVVWTPQTRQGVSVGRKDSKERATDRVEMHDRGSTAEMTQA